MARGPTNLILIHFSYWPRIFFRMLRAIKHNSGLDPTIKAYLLAKRIYLSYFEKTIDHLGFRDAPLLRKSQKKTPVAKQTNTKLSVYTVQRDTQCSCSD